jgi:hypothetical protein
MILLDDTLVDPKAMSADQIARRQRAMEVSTMIILSVDGIKPKKATAGYQDPTSPDAAA